MSAVYLSLDLKLGGWYLGPWYRWICRSSCLNHKSFDLWWWHSNRYSELIGCCLPPLEYLKQGILCMGLFRNIVSSAKVLNLTGLTILQHCQIIIYCQIYNRYSILNGDGDESRCVSNLQLQTMVLRKMLLEIGT